MHQQRRASALKSRLTVLILTSPCSDMESILCLDFIITLQDEGKTAVEDVDSAGWLMFKLGPALTKPVLGTQAGHSDAKQRHVIGKTNVTCTYLLTCCHFGEF